MRRAVTRIAARARAHRLQRGRRWSRRSFSTERHWMSAGMRKHAKQVRTPVPLPIPVSSEIAHPFLWPSMARDRLVKFIVDQSDPKTSTLIGRMTAYLLAMGMEGGVRGLRFARGFRAPKAGRTKRKPGKEGGKAKKRSAPKKRSTSGKAARAASSQAPASTSAGSEGQQPSELPPPQSPSQDDDQPDKLGPALFKELGPVEQAALITVMEVMLIPDSPKEVDTLSDKEKGTLDAALDVCMDEELLKLADVDTLRATLQEAVLEIRNKIQLPEDVDIKGALKTMEGGLANASPQEIDNLELLTTAVLQQITPELVDRLFPLVSKFTQGDSIPPAEDLISALDKALSQSEKAHKPQGEYKQPVEPNPFDEIQKQLEQFVKDPFEQGTGKDQKGGKGGKPGEDGEGSGPDPNMGLFGIVAGFLGLIVLASIYEKAADGEEITYAEFRRLLRQKPGSIESLEIQTDRRICAIVPGGSGAATGEQKFFFYGSLETLERNLEEDQIDMGRSPEQFLPIKFKTTDRRLSVILMEMVPWVFFIGVLMFLNRNLMKGGANPFGMMDKMTSANKYKIGEAERPDVSFKDVAGMEAAKEEIMEFVHFLQHPDRYSKLGAKIPKGALLEGPPGTGKTLLAKACAGEAGVNFYSLSGSDFVEMFVGVGASRVRQLFEAARNDKPSIIFIDEIDAIGKKRSSHAMGGHSEREATLNTLLVEMDGFKSDESVVVLASTNRADILDPALKRPGRLDRQITVNLPTLTEREQIMRVHLRNIPLPGDHEDSAAVFARRIAAMIPGFSGADMRNICNEAAIVAARNGDETVRMKHFESAIDRVIAGAVVRSMMPDDRTRNIVAHHEAGHAVAAWTSPYGTAPVKVTIVPRSKGALGFAQTIPDEGLFSRKQYMAQLETILGGRVAEEIFFDDITQGASDDIMKATEMARKAARQFGFARSELGLIRYEYDENGKAHWGASAQSKLDEIMYSDMDTAYKTVTERLTKHKKDMERLAERLLEVESVSHDDLVELLGPCQSQSSAYRKFRASHNEIKQQIAEEEEVAAKLHAKLMHDKHDDDDEDAAEDKADKDDKVDSSKDKKDDADDGKKGDDSDDDNDEGGGGGGGVRAMPEYSITEEEEARELAEEREESSQTPKPASAARGRE